MVAFVHNLSKTTGLCVYEQESVVVTFVPHHLSKTAGSVCVRWRMWWSPSCCTICLKLRVPCGEQENVVVAFVVHNLSKTTGSMW